MGRAKNLLQAAVRTKIRRRFGVRKPHILLACMPKSASSFLANAIAELPGLQQRDVSGRDPHKEQELDPFLLSYHDLEGYVAQQHVRYSLHCEQMIREFGITPVVLVRNLEDCVASIRDHGRQNPPRTYKWFTADLTTISDSEMEEYIADYMMPWYVQFEVSWQQCPTAVWVHYDEVRTNTKGVLERIAAAANMKVTAADIEAAANSAVGTGKRFNKGVSGRGQDITPYARERIQKLLSRYPDHEFRCAPKTHIEEP